MTFDAGSPDARDRWVALIMGAVLETKGGQNNDEKMVSAANASPAAAANVT